MKVSIYKLPNGKMDALVEAAVGHGKAPVLVQDVTGENIKERILPVIVHQRGRVVREARDL